MQPNFYLWRKNDPNKFEASFGLAMALLKTGQFNSWLEVRLLQKDLSHLNKIGLEDVHHLLWRQPLQGKPC